MCSRDLTLAACGGDERIAPTLHCPASLRFSFTASILEPRSVWAAVWLCCALCGLVPDACGAVPPAFPGALGFGANATGGRGGTVYHVTTLADSGAGSFRDAVSQPNRTVVFDVGGYITLASSVSVKNNITIAGQTGPGGGIGIRGREVSFGSSTNIICRHVRFRPGDAAPNNDNGINFYQSTNIIVDHVSIEFANWNNIDAVNCDKITVQNSIIADPLYQQFGAHTEHLDSTFSWFYNVFVNGHNRQPLAKIHTIFINNVVYNYQAAYTVANTSGHFSHDIINNYFIAGPATGTPGNDFYQMNANQSIYAAGNLRDSNKDGVLNGAATTPGGGGTVLVSPWSALTPGIPTFTTAGAYRYSVSLAGAFPRDPVDALAISQIQTLGNGPTGTGPGTAGPDGSLYSSEAATGLPNGGFGTISGGSLPLDSDGDGLPDYWETALGLNPNNAADGNIIGPNGYTHLEDYLNWMAGPHVATQTNTAIEVDLRKYAAGFANNATCTVSGAVNGTVTLTNGSTARFVPNAGFSGLGSFVFTVSDGFTMTNTIGVAISATSPPSNLIWRGDGSANLWDTTAPNWFNGMNLAAFKGGDSVTFDDGGSTTPSINLPAAVAPAAFTFDSTKNYTLTGNGALNGGMSLTKLGTGALTLNTTNAYSGGTLAGAGTLVLGTTMAAGSGSLTLDGSILSLAGPGGPATYNNALTIASPSTMVTPGSGNNNQALGGALTGSASLSVNTGSGGTFSARGAMGGYSGTIGLTGAGTFRWQGSSGSSSAAFDLGAGNAAMITRDGGTITLGALSGGTNTWLKGAGSTANPTTYVIGGKNVSTTFSGIITNGFVSGASVSTALVKTGTGTLTLTGANNYSGPTTVTNGVLVVDGNNGPSPFVVATAGTLSGTGSVGGQVTLNSGGKLGPGNGVGTLTLAGGLTLTGGSMTFDLANVTTVGSGVNDLISMLGGTLTLSGTIAVMPNLVNGALANGIYTLISGGNSTSGSAANLAWGGPAGGRQSFGFDTMTPGAVLLEVGGSPAATLIWQGTNGTSWDLSTTNWLKGTASDRFYNLDAVVFDDSALGGAVSIASALQPGLIAVTNSALDYTLTGPGILSGPMQLLKAGNGNLTLDATNAFTGGLLAVAGNTVLNNVSAAGSGPIRFAGGVVTYAGPALSSYPNSLSFTATSTIVSTGGANNTVNGDWTGASNLAANISIPSGLFSVTGSMLNFLGTVDLGGSAGSFRVNVPTGGTFDARNTSFDLGSNTGQLMNRNGAPITLAALSGGPGTALSGANSVDAPSAYRIGANNASTTFAGTIKDGSSSTNRPTAIVKIGTGTWTLTGASTYTGGTSVSAGTLRVNNPVGSGTGVGDVSVAAGATLSGNGHLDGDVLLDDGAILAPGSSIGVLTFNGDLTLNDATQLQFELGTNSDQVIVNGSLFASGILNISNAGGFGAGSYTLFAYDPASPLGYGNLSFGSRPDGYLYTINTNTPGQIILAVSDPSASPPGFGGVFVSGGALVLTGSGGAPNAAYYLLSSSNLALLATGWTRLATSHFDALGSFSNFVPMLPGSRQGFFRILVE